jgi:hypothetical protein
MYLTVGVAGPLYACVQLYPKVIRTREKKRPGSKIVNERFEEGKRFIISVSIVRESIRIFEYHESPIRVDGVDFCI